jgi:hypothetical protein
VVNQRLSQASDGKITNVDAIWLQAKAAIDAGKPVPQALQDYWNLTEQTVTGVSNQFHAIDLLSPGYRKQFEDWLKQAQQPEPTPATETTDNETPSNVDNNEQPNNEPKNPPPTNDVKPIAEPDTAVPSRELAVLHRLGNDAHSQTVKNVIAQLRQDNGWLKSITAGYVVALGSDGQLKEWVSPNALQPGEGFVRLYPGAKDLVQIVTPTIDGVQKQYRPTVVSVTPDSATSTNRTTQSITKNVDRYAVGWMNAQTGDVSSTQDSEHTIRLERVDSADSIPLTVSNKPWYYKIVGGVIIWSQVRGEGFKEASDNLIKYANERGNGPPNGKPPGDTRPVGGGQEDDPYGWKESWYFKYNANRGGFEWSRQPADGWTRANRARFEELQSAGQRPAADNTRINLTSTKLQQTWQKFSGLPWDKLIGAFFVGTTVYFIADNKANQGKQDTLNQVAALNVRPFDFDALQAQKESDAIITDVNPRTDDKAVSAARDQLWEVYFVQGRQDLERNATEINLRLTELGKATIDIYSPNTGLLARYDKSVALLRAELKQHPLAITPNMTLEQFAVPRLTDADSPSLAYQRERPEASALEMALLNRGGQSGAGIIDKINGAIGEKIKRIVDNKLGIASGVSGTPGNTPQTNATPKPDVVLTQLADNRKLSAIQNTLRTELRNAPLGSLAQVNALDNARLAVWSAYLQQGESVLGLKGPALTQWRTELARWVQAGGNRPFTPFSALANDDPLKQRYASFIEQVNYYSGRDSDILLRDALHESRAAMQTDAGTTPRPSPLADQFVQRLAPIVTTLNIESASMNLNQAA